MRVLIIGATGFCGRALTSTLAKESGYIVIPHIRSNSRRATSVQTEWTTLGIEGLCAHWTDMREKILKLKPDVIATFLGTTKRHMRTGQGTYQEIDYGLNKLLIDIALELETPPLFIYLSSMGLEWAKWSEYLKVRVNIENTLNSSTLPHIIIRPGMLSGSSRDESRPLEHVSSLVFNTLTRIYRTLSLHQWADSIQPLDAPEVASFLLKAISVYRQTPPSSHPYQITYTLPEIHKTLRSQTFPIPK